MQEQEPIRAHLEWFYAEQRIYNEYSNMVKNSPSAFASDIAEQIVDYDDNASEMLFEIIELLFGKRYDQQETVGRLREAFKDAIDNTATRLAEKAVEDR